MNEPKQIQYLLTDMSIPESEQGDLQHILLCCINKPLCFLSRHWRKLKFWKSIGKIESALGLQMFELTRPIGVSLQTSSSSTPSK